MSEMTVGIREFKAHLGRYLRRVKAGESLVITVRGEPMGRIIPTTAPADSAALDARMAAIVAAGLADWNGQRFQPGEPVAENQGETTLAELIVEEREAGLERLL